MSDSHNVLCRSPGRASASRRCVLAGAATLAVSPALMANTAQAQRAGPRFAPARGDDRQEWLAFKRRFVSEDGRVLDTGNGGCSHSEGQGWGLTFAVAFDDPQTFDLILGWTARHLRVRTDSLHAWRYLPGAATPVGDLNNATDGDLFIGAALWRAAVRWGRPDHASAARSIAQDVLRLLVREAGPRTMLLPGASGFDTPDALTVNPSYYAFQAMADLADAAPSPLWTKLRDDGVAMIEAARFGQWQLPPDWLQVARHDGTLTPHPHWPARFSFDAIRVPLWLAWAGLGHSPVQHAIAAYWAASPPVPPAWVDLETNAMAGYPAPPGMVAVAQIAAIGTRDAVKAQFPVGFPTLRTSPDYYSAALILLARLAWQEIQDA